MRTIQPDIVVRPKGSQDPVVIVDTKWKTPRNGQPADADLKQMFAYNETYRCSRSLLLYPAELEAPSGVAGRFAAGRHSCGTAYVGMIADRKLSTPRVVDEIRQLLGREQDDLEQGIANGVPARQ